MNYSVLIDNRVSSRAFQNKEIPEKVLSIIREYHDKSCERLIPQIQTELVIVSKGAKEKLESAAGYNEFLIGAPQYLVLLSENKEGAVLNAGFIMEDMMLRISDLGYGSCWLTFTDSEKIKDALNLKTDKMVAALAAFGLPERTRKRIHLNIITMSKVDISDKRHYFDPKKKITELVHYETFGSKEGLEDHIGFYDDILWEAFRAAANSPSYMNRQPYSFLMKEGKVLLLSEEDALTGPIDRDLNLGAVMLHFISVAKEYAGSLCWKPGNIQEPLPEGVKVIASCEL